MIKILKFSLLLLISFSVLICAYIYLQLPTKQDQKILTEAFQDYVEGEQSQKFGSREENFNNALLLYTQIERKYNSRYSDGKLFYNIGNSFFQLSQYPWAALYYYKALDLMPTDQNVKDNLAITQAKLGLSISQKNPFSRKLFFLHYNYSIPNRLMAFFVIGLILLGFLSLYIWKPRNWLKSLNVLIGFCLSAIFISLMISQYFTPLRAMVVHASAIYKDAGEQYMKVTEQPVKAGQLIEVLDILEEGKWLKIITPDGVLGFVPAESIRLIK
jgi:tetratricopeptide (TPR) repeat protein